MAMGDNADLFCFYTTKHSTFRGKYKRIFSIGSHGISTYNTTTLEVTNAWTYSDVVNIQPKPNTGNEFLLTIKKGPSKTDSMRFSTEHRADLITKALNFKNYFSSDKTILQKFNGYKQHWSETRRQVVLQIGHSGVDHLEPSSGRTLHTYNYKDISALAVVSDIPGGFAIISTDHSMIYVFAVEQRDELFKAIGNAAAANVGASVRVRPQSLTLEHCVTNKYGKFSDDESITSYAEFIVQKITKHHSDPVRRILCLAETCLLERDVATYNIVNCKPLSEVFALIRSRDDPQRVSIEYINGDMRIYTSTDRDSLIASLLDGVRASGNRDVCVKMKPTCRGYRLGPLTFPVDEEVESQHMKFIQSPPVGVSSDEAVNRFNCNVSYSGLLHAVTQDKLFAQNKEKLIYLTLANLLENEGDQTSISDESLEAQFQALRRLVASKAGFEAFTNLPKMREKVGIKVIKALKRQDDAVTHAAIDMLTALMQPMHDNYDLRQEQLNKASLLSSKAFLEQLLEQFKNHVVRGTGALVIASMLDFLTYSLCAPYSETTDGGQFDTLLELVALNGRVMYKLFQHPSMAIVKGAGLVMKAIIEEGDSEIATKMQDLALAEGALPRHLLTAMFTQSHDNRMLTNRQLSRHLVGLWVTGHETAMNLLSRILPLGLMRYLESEDEVPENEADRLHVRDNLKLAVEHQFRSRRMNWRMLERKIDGFLQHWRARAGLQRKKENPNDKPIVLRKRRQRIKIEANWPLFYYQFNQDHAKSDLIWNYKTREELREAFENELRAFNVDKELGASHVISWNFQEFSVPYDCLSDEVKVGNYYLRLLLEEDEKSEDNEASDVIKNSYEFFNDLYHRFLLTTSTSMRCLCLQAMAVVYGRCHMDIGQFNDTRFIIGMLDRTTDRLERDRLLQFISRLILNPVNVTELLLSNGVRILVDLLPLAHLHISRATVPLQSNVIEAAPDMKREPEKEWYYRTVEKGKPQDKSKPQERCGPYSIDEMKRFWSEEVINAKSRCWAQGMDGWKPLQLVPQLKWTLVASGQAVMNESDLSSLILTMLIRMAEYYPSRDGDGAVIRPLPRVKRLLSEATCLPHVVQLLLTFDPIIVEKVSTLLYLIMQDNPDISRLYLSGVFFFIMMYTGSNVLPVARFLQYTHLKQAFRSDDNKTSDIMIRSILGHMLPEAMVCYLDNYSPDKFAQTFLGEFDTPESIWNSEMRRLMIEKIASHLSDFTPRLQSNTRALYQYCPIPVISFPQLENELFCNIYYLKHLCDTTRFPDWPIKDPIKLMKDTLEAWKKEVDKKVSTMSMDEAQKILGLPSGVGGHDESKIRKAYFRMAAKYHPDKNPEGREMFEKVNKAYEFLCTKSRVTQGPNPHNIILILKTQSIILCRHKEELEPYKYAGYPMLIKTIRMETNDETLFSKSAPLLIAATELAYHTVNCSALNAEELRREQGIETLQGAFSRCMDVLSTSSKEDDLAVQVCTHITRCYSVAAQFEACRQRIQENESIIRDVCRILYFKNVPKLCQVVAECLSSFGIDYWLQMDMFKAGALWHLLLYVFNYDYTLEEGGVEKSNESNQQEVANILASLSIRACSRMSGFTPDTAPTPNNPTVKQVLMALLTPYLARKLADEDHSQLLKLLNSNTENPYLMWDNSTRIQLTEYLTENQDSLITMGTCDQSYGADFVFELHSKELIIGEIFVRLYNEQPAFQLENAKGFTIDLLDFLGSQAQYMHSLMSLQNKETNDNAPQNQRLAHVQQALEALRNVMVNNPGVEFQCIGHFKLIFSLLSLRNCAKLQQFAIEVLKCVAVNQECVNDIAASSVLAYLLMTIHTLPQYHSLVLEALFSLMSSTKIVKEALHKGAPIYLLDLFCNATDPKVRQQTAELFSKMLSDKLVGPKVRILLNKFLPPIFMDAMRDSSEASVHMFEGAHENPELIWNDESREKVSNIVNRMKWEHYNSQVANPDVKWTMPDDFNVVFTDVAGEVVVGGVFLRLFIANPAWVLRRPREFLTELLEMWSSLVSSKDPDGEMLEMVTTGVVCLFQAQSVHLDQVPSLGYVPRVFHAMLHKNDAIPKAAIQVAHQLAHNEFCIRSMSTIDSIPPFKVAMDLRRDMVALAADGLSKIFDKGYEELVSQALQCGMVEFLLKILESGCNSVENPSATKAQIVKVLKAMQRSLEYGEQITKILDQSPIWPQYRDQLHGLFITDSAIAGYLTGPTTPAVAGYLTAGTRTTMPNKPPPVDHGHDIRNTSR